MTNLELVQKAIDQQDLTQAQSEQLFNAIVTGELEPITLSALLIALKIKGEQPEEISGAATALKNHALAFPATDYVCSDNCGTGGDGTHTINISTLCAIVAASLGVKMAKHGNRSVSSKSGSADVLSELGINLNMTPEQAKKCLDETNLTFLMAPVYHSGIRHAMPVRQTLKTRTVFNILGPLINPAGAEVQIIGVYQPELIKPVVESLRLLNKKAAWVVHGSGMDEVALHGPTKVAQLLDDEITYFEVSPSDFELEHYELSEIQGGTPTENAQNILQVLQGNGCDAHNSAIVINTAPLLVLNGIADNLKQASNMVKQQLASGQAIGTLNQFVELSNKQSSQGN
ncbi:MAG: anthranilate phosphoribosyltransferase [Gammaproteobacteria bacterium]|nr:anthranilate phosphoribosyltransferase [Gammaproteobacteria bacterium]